MLEAASKSADGRTRGGSQVDDKPGFESHWREPLQQTLARRSDDEIGRIECCGSIVELSLRGPRVHGHAR